MPDMNGVQVLPSSPVAFMGLPPLQPPSIVAITVSLPPATLNTWQKSLNKAVSGFAQCAPLSLLVYRPSPPQEPAYRVLPDFVITLKPPPPGQPVPDMAQVIPLSVETH